MNVRITREALKEANIEPLSLIQLKTRDNKPSSFLVTVPNRIPIANIRKIEYI